MNATPPDHLDAVRIALAELGYPPDAVRTPTPAELSNFPGCDLMIADYVSETDAWRAGALYRYVTNGTNDLNRCPQASGRSWSNSCPGHPVGALLAGTDPGCTPQ